MGVLAVSCTCIQRPGGFVKEQNPGKPMWQPAGMQVPTQRKNNLAREGEAIPEHVSGSERIDKWRLNKVMGSCSL
jgi:hypothetical protein